MNKSFLICDNDAHIGFYANGIELAIYDKKTKQLTISTKDNDKVVAANDAFFAASLMLSIELEKIKTNSK
jgi:hypothetical protein